MTQCTVIPAHYKIYPTHENVSRSFFALIFSPSSFLLNYKIFLFSCIPTRYINHHRNIDIVFNHLISNFIALTSEDDMLKKVPKTKDFYVFALCSNTIVSTCLVAAILMTVEPVTPLASGYIFNNSDIQHLFFIK